MGGALIRVGALNRDYTVIESRNFALIFLGKRPFNTLSKMELSDIVIVTMDFYLHSAQEMLI